MEAAEERASAILSQFDEHNLQMSILSIQSHGYPAAITGIYMPCFTHFNAVMKLTKNWLSIDHEGIKAAPAVDVGWSGHGVLVERVDEERING